MQRAFREDALVERSRAALSFLFEDLSRQRGRITSAMSRARKAGAARELADLERRLHNLGTVEAAVKLERDIVNMSFNALMVKRGLKGVSTAPNPAARAMRRMADEDPVTFLKYKREEQERDRQARDANRQAGKDQVRDERRASGLPVREPRRRTPPSRRSP